MEIAAVMVLGAALGGVGGYLLSKAQCASGACKSRPQVIYTIVAGAVFGAAIAYYFARR